MEWNHENTIRYPTPSNMDGEGTPISVDDTVDLSDLRRYGICVDDIISNSEFEMYYDFSGSNVYLMDPYNHMAYYYYCMSMSGPPPEESNRGLFREVAIQWEVEAVFDQNLEDFESDEWDGNIDLRATFTTQANGDYDAGATWVGGVAPGVGDDVSIGHDVLLNGNQTCVGVVYTAGSIVPTNTTNTFTINGPLVITNGTLGNATWTGKLTIGGNMSGTGTYSHGNQECEFNGAGKMLENTFTFYDLTLTDTILFTFESGADITVEHTLKISSWKGLLMRSQTADTTLTLGTASASGTFTIDANGLLKAHTDGGTFNSIIQAANASYYANLEGVGVYDWDYGTSNGEVHLAHVNMKGSDASAKTSGGGGVTIVLGNTVNFYEDWEVATNDTFNCATNKMAFVSDVKTYTQSGTIQNGGTLQGGGGGAQRVTIVNADGFTNLAVASTTFVHLDGTNSFGATGVTWIGGTTGDLLPYDSTSILNVTGGITVPAGTYFGADNAGNMGDGNPVSGWTADMSWGWLRANIAGGVVYLSSGNTIINSGSLSYSFNTDNATFHHNNGTITLTHVGEQRMRADHSFNNIIVDSSALVATRKPSLAGDLTIVDGSYYALNDTDSIAIVGTTSISSASTFGHNTWAPTLDVTIGEIDCSGEIYFPAQSGGGDMIINGAGFSVDSGSTVHHDNGHVQFQTNGACAIDCTHELYDVTFDHAALVANTHYINAGNSYTFTAIQEMAGASTGYVVGADIASLPTMIITDMNYCGVDSVTTGGAAVIITLNTKGFFKNLTVSLNDIWTSNGNMKKCGTGGTWTVDGTWNVNADAYAWDIDNTGTITVAGGVSVYYFGTFSETGAGSHTGTIDIYSVLHDVQLTDVQFTGG